MKGTYDPYVRGRVDDFGLRGEEGHALSRGSLFLGLVMYIYTVLQHNVHASQRLLVVFERLVECLRERGICDVYIRVSIRM